MRTNFLKPVLILVLSSGVLNAAEKALDLGVRNPSIQKLESRMSERAAKLNGWKDRGAIGEAATGLLEARTMANQNLVEKKEIRDLVAAENNDRNALFREILLANKLEFSELGRVATAFAAKQHGAAAVGHHVQDLTTKVWGKK